MKRFSNLRVQRKYRLMPEQHSYITQIANHLTEVTGKKVEISDVLGGMIDHYRLGMDNNAKEK